MSTLTQTAQNARGASSSFTQVSRSLTRPLDGRGLFAPDRDVPAARSCGELIDDLWTIRDLDRPPVRSWAQLAGDLQALRGLKDDWDGQDAVAPPPALVDGAGSLLQYFRGTDLDPADRVIAGVSGTVSFEWHGPGGCVEVEVVDPGRADVYVVRRGSPEAKSYTLVRYA